MASVLEQLPETKAINEGLTLPDSPPIIRLFTVDEYHQMIEAGIFNEDDRVELLAGRIIETSPKSIGHANANEEAADYFKSRLKKKALVRSQNPILLDDASEPEPDIVIVKTPKQKYRTQHPMPPDILMVMEIADSSLSKDRNLKGEAYAICGIAQYVILNLKGREVEDYREPSTEGYRSKQTYTAQQSFNLVAFPDVTIAVSDLLPPV